MPAAMASQSLLTRAEVGYEGPVRLGAVQKRKRSHQRGSRLTDGHQHTSSSVTCAGRRLFVPLEIIPADICDSLDELQLDLGGQDTPC